MHTARLMVVAFILNGGDVLLMRRSQEARLFPGMWAPVGGHIEPSELRIPQSACEREIIEEAGFSAQDISRLSLRYIVHRVHREEIRIQFAYFCTARHRRLGSTDEGELHWLPVDAAATLDVSATTRFMIDHYLKTGLLTKAVYVGAVNAENGSPVIAWSPIGDWEQLQCG